MFDFWNQNGQSGLLGLGGFQGLGGPQMKPGLLDQFYDPEELRRAQMKQALLGAGIAMLGQEPSKVSIGFGESMAKGLQGGLLGAQQAGQDYKENALLGYDLFNKGQDNAWQQEQRGHQRGEWEQEAARRKAISEMTSTLPEDQRRLAQAYPDEYAKSKLKTVFPDSGGTEYGLNPVWLQNPQTGRYMLVQPSKDGSAPRQMQFPDGYIPAPPNRTLDTGTGYVNVPTRGAGQPYQGTEIEKNLRGAEQEKEIGQQQGKMIASAPGDMAAAEMALGLIDDIRGDPNREQGTGYSSFFNFVPGTSGYDFQNKVDQATSGAFLTAIQQMRGLGALSNAEGQTATRAVTRMNTATSEDAFVAALNDYEAIVRKAYDRAAARVAQPSQGGSRPDLYQKYGLE